MLIVLRRIVQTFFVILFVSSFILIGGHFIFQLDPALALTTTLASRSWIFLFWPALIIAILTLIIGRFFCGWICPLGSLLDAFHFLTNFIKRQKISKKLKCLKYIFLSILIISAFWGWQWSGYLNPFSILFRSIHFLSTANISFWALVSLASLVGIFLLEFLDQRFWCRYLCPSGALMGCLAQFSWLQHQPKKLCPQCGICSKDCPAFDDDDENFHPSECHLCLECLQKCPKNLTQFSWQKPASPKFDSSRRTFLASLGSGLLVPAAAYALTKKKSSDLPADFIRPPGVKSENDFLNACVRCGACLNICPTRGLQSSWLESGAEGIFSPRLIPRLGYCDYKCNACGQACPTGAIPAFPLQEKQQQILGKAQIDVQRCVGCGTCIHICPVHAIDANELEIIGVSGEKNIRYRPRVKKETCVGCGTCENHCPVEGEAAIRVSKK